jgi:hypothetical protein
LADFRGDRDKPSFQNTYTIATRLDDAGTSVAVASGGNRNMLRITGTTTTEEHPLFLRLEGQVRGPWG